MVGMASTSGDATPPSPKMARLIEEMIKLSDQRKLRRVWEEYTGLVKL